MGTRVFPHADVKFFLDADVAVRARRRQQELTERGHTIPLDQVREDMIARDDRDRHRKTDPLHPAQDAVMVETSEQPVEHVVEQMMGIISDRL